MPFQREVYYTLKLINNLTRRYPAVQRLDDDDLKFYTVRTLELYYRSVSEALQDDPSVRDKWVAVCFWIVHKFYFSDKLYSVENFQSVMQRNPSDAEAFKEDFVDTERRIQCCVQWAPVMQSLVSSSEELAFFEPWQFSRDAQRPADYNGPHAADVMATVLEHVECFKVVFHVHKLARWQNSEHFFMITARELNPVMLKMREALSIRCKVDSVFCALLRAYCADRYDGVLPSWMPAPVCAPRPAAELVGYLNAAIVQDAKAELLGHLRVMERDMRAAHARTEGEVTQEVYDSVKECIKNISTLQDYATAAAKAMRAISPSSAEECEEVGQAIDALIVEAVQRLKRSPEVAERKRKAEMPPPEPLGADMTFTRTVAEKKTLMCTRVNADGYRTPLAGVQHRVQVIQAAVKVVTTTYVRRPGSLFSDVQSVQVSENFNAACEALAAAYVTRNAAFDARHRAAQASEMEAKASADERSSAACAAEEAARVSSEADTAAAAAAAAAVAAEEAEVAAARAAFAAEARR